MFVLIFLILSAFFKDQNNIWKPDLKCESTVFECVFYQAIAGESSGTRTLRLHATRSLSVAISLRGALLCIWRTPSICPLRLRPTLGGDETSVGELTDPTHTDQTCNQHQHYCYQYYNHPPPVYRDHLNTFYFLQKW